MKRRVVVTGLGCVTSLACQVDELFKRLLAGESGIHPLRIIDTERFKVKFGGDVYDWEPERWPAAFVEKPDSFTEKKEIKRLDRFSQFAMVAGHEAVNDSGLDFSQGRPVPLRRDSGQRHRRAARDRRGLRQAVRQGAGSRQPVRRAEDDAQCGRRQSLDSLRPARESTIRWRRRVPARTTRSAMRC